LRRRRELVGSSRRFVVLFLFAGDIGEGRILQIG